MWRYLLSLLLIGVAIAGRAWAEHVGWGPHRFPMLQTGIILSALFGGVGPGMFAMVLGTAAYYLFLPPAGTFYLLHAIDGVDVVTFAAVNGLIAWAFGSLRASWRGYPNSAAPAAATDGSLVLVLGSPRVLVGLLALALGLGAFGLWGIFSSAGTEHFQDEATSIPLICLGLSPAVLIFGIGFLPVVSFRNSTEPAERSPIR